MEHRIRSGWCNHLNTLRCDMESRITGEIVQLFAVQTRQTLVVQHVFRPLHTHVGVRTSRTTRAKREGLTRRIAHGGARLELVQLRDGGRGRATVFDSDAFRT